MVPQLLPTSAMCMTLDLFLFIISNVVSFAEHIIQILSIDSFAKRAQLASDHMQNTAYGVK